MLDDGSTKNLPPVASRGRYYSGDSYLSRLVHWIDENLSESRCSGFKDLQDRKREVSSSTNGTTGINGTQICVPYTD